MKSKSKPVVTITSTEDTTYAIVGTRLVEQGLYDRVISLPTLGKLLRVYKTTKKTAGKNIRVFYGRSHSSSGKTEFAYVVPVLAQRFSKGISIGCVNFVNENATKLRRAALRNSKVTA